MLNFTVVSVWKNDYKNIGTTMSNYNTRIDEIGEKYVIDLFSDLMHLSDAEKDDRDVYIIINN